MLAESGETEQLRLFFALWPDPVVRECIAAETAAVMREIDGRHLPPANFHVTLAFLGAVAVTDLPEIQAAGQRVASKPFELQLTCTDYWGRSQIAWLGPAESPPELAALVNSLHTELATVGVSPDTEEFQPHVSLARRATGCPKIDLATPINWPVSGFALVRSRPGNEGSVYTLLEQYSAED